MSTSQAPFTVCRGPPNWTARDIISLFLCEFYARRSSVRGRRERYEALPPVATSRPDEVSMRTCPGGTIAYGLFMVDRTVEQAAATVAGRLDDALGDTTRSIQELLVAEISELSGDQQLLQLLRDTVAVNVDAFFSSIRHGIPVRNLEPATAALEYARRLAQREVSVDVLMRAYRLGHQAALTVALEEIRASNLDPKLRLDVFELMAAVSFEYIDWISQQVVATYQEERERWLEKRNSLRTLQVRELLAKSPRSRTNVDIDAMFTVIRYPLRRTHLAVVLWCEETHRDGLAAM